MNNNGKIKIYNYVPPMGLKKSALDFIEEANGLWLSYGIFEDNNGLHVNINLFPADGEKSLCFAHFCDDKPHSKKIKLESVKTLDEYKGKGLGQIAINALVVDENVCRHKVCWWASRILNKAWPFYEKIGCKCNKFFDIASKKIDYSVYEQFELDTNLTQEKQNVETELRYY